MISVLESKAVLYALRLDQEVQAENKENRTLRNPSNPPVHLDKTDEQFWALTPGVTGAKTSKGELAKKGCSIYSWGPYPRNRRVLADFALAAGWDVKKAQMLERRRCINAMKTRLKEVSRGANVSGHQPTKDGTPYTFQHIAWSDLASRIKREFEEIDSLKLAVVCYIANSKATNGDKSSLHL